jgi:hypothetical protein
MQEKIEKLSKEMMYVKPMNTKLMIFATFLFFTIIAVALILLFLNFPQIQSLIKKSIVSSRLVLGFFLLIQFQYLFGFDLFSKGW